MPTVVKEARGESYAGRHFVTDRDDLIVPSADLRYPVLAQEAVTGEEYAVELPVRNGVVLPPRPPGAEPRAFVAGPANRTPDLPGEPVRQDPGA
ncbi:hypothetical protein [Saccharothrix longispora]|uniref:hypothetical protein n=1 Tax=Saccharothrix longispora TaxID=33920 RepID=UPI002905A6DE|nr:hypothetical protein [Saccharothrix longispora]